jgi:hypothetical protein
MLSKQKQQKKFELRKPAGAKTTLAAPHVYRPPQRKTVTAHSTATVPSVPRALQRKQSIAPAAVKNSLAQTHASTPPTTSTRTVVQRFTSRVAQAVKFYPNLHPGAVEPIDPNNVFRLNSFANQYRLHKVHSHGVNVPNQQYNFVRTREGEMLLHSRYRHPSIAEGKQVLYAGEIYFNNGQLEWWSNGSGHYQPYAEDAGQANLPMDQFYSYQQIIKGEHKRKKG